MGKLATYVLQQLVNIQELQHIQERFAASIGLGVIITNEDGQPVTKASNFTNFCTKMRETVEGLHHCMHSDQQLGQKAAKELQAVAHRCHAGLLDLAAPVVLNGQHIGSVLCGQVLLTKPSAIQLYVMQERFRKLSIDEDLLARCWEELHVANDKQIETTLHMLQLLADYIAKMSSYTLVEQRQLYARQELESMLARMQLNVLQSQVSPHFLFETLNTLSRIAYLENATQTQEVTYAFANMLRYSMQNTSQLVSLQQELDYINSYITIQQCRFRQTIVYNVQLRVDATDVYVPMFSLQPIIENAIIHGLANIPGEKSLMLHIYEKHNNIYIDITDNGIGMSKQQCHALLTSTVKCEKTSMGISHVQQRMNYYFGEAYGIYRIKSNIHEGTTVQLVVPAKEV